MSHSANTFFHFPSFSSVLRYPQSVFGDTAASLSSISEISRKARKAGPLAKRVSDAISQSRASSLVKRFKNAAPAWLAQATPCAPA
jgi:hypothetical protein